MSHKHPIRVVSKRTGMSPHLIRMWERRYSAITPKRTETGRRFYTDEEIERLELLHRATLEGQSIGQIANLTDDQLRELVEVKAPDKEIIMGDESVDHHFGLCMQSIENLDANELESRLLRASMVLGHRTFLDKLIHRLMEEIGVMWSDGRLSVSHEHLASAVVRSLLGSMHLANAKNLASPLLIGATPAGQNHEFGALMALVSASSAGWRTLYLGPNLPGEDIAAAAINKKASAIALSVVYPNDDPALPNELRKIRELIPEKVTLLVGGRSASAYEKALREIDAISVTGLTQFISALEEVKRSKRFRNIGSRKA